ncbi:unnamed protein product [Lymnaea stagnalis]|uniref:Dermatopontin n=1 Tax=Lymnaea stagnalis TaxID=6523 RepID=A0AAV2I4H1_LYMST
MSSLVSSLLVIVFTVATVTCDVAWMTPLSTSWAFECPNGSGLKILQSASIYATNDRQWSFTCGDDDAALTNLTCEWSPYVNDYYWMFNFQCPNEGVVTGMASDHNGYDRRHTFLCCFPTGYIAHACVFTPNINALGGFMNYRRPDNWYIRGFSSEFSQLPNGYHDRVFILNICKLDKLTSS